MIQGEESLKQHTKRVYGHLSRLAESQNDVHPSESFARGSNTPNKKRNA